MKKRIFVISLVLAVIVIGINLGSAMEKPTPGDPVTVTGKLGFRERSGGYYVHSESPQAVLIIVNQDPAVLETLYKNGTPVTIEGHLAGGADLLFIEKINGKPYAGPRVNK